MQGITIQHMGTRTPPKESLARNLRFLMDLEVLSEAAVAKRSKVSQKAINNILNGTSGGTLNSVDKIADAFGLTAWHLIMPNLPDELIAGKSIEKLYNSFITSDEAGREYTLHVAEREASYKDRSTG